MENTVNKGNQAKIDLKIRQIVSHPGIAERADKVVRIIFDAYVLPNKTLPELRAMIESGALDPLRDFSEACHEELSLLSSQALQFEYRRGREPISSIES